jgi:hypothetical protein
MYQASVRSRQTAAATAGKLQRAVVLALGACTLATTAACASVVYNPDHLAPDQLSQIGAVCQSVMGLPPATYSQHEACVESLSHAYVARLQSGRLLAARQDCLAHGLRPGTTALSECELDPAPQAATQNAPPMLQVALPPHPPKSYFGASFDEIRRREQHACAAIGYDPAGSGFGQCVADLAAELGEVDHPVD